MNEWMYDWVMLNDDAYAVDVVSEWRYILYNAVFDDFVKVDSKW